MDSIKSIFRWCGLWLAAMIASAWVRGKKNWAVVVAHAFLAVIAFFILYTGYCYWLSYLEWAR